MRTSELTYVHDRLELKGYLAQPAAASSSKRPAVLVVHDWSGRNEFSCDKAEMLAAMGYIGFAVDMYGQAKTGQTVEEKQALMAPVINDRVLLAGRMIAALEAVRGLEEVDVSRIAVIGFCFGGLCALDLARTGAALAGVVSFHGLLGRPSDQAISPIRAKILALHGNDDPMVTPDDFRAFCDEMTASNADWQAHVYGGTQHAFTNPKAHDLNLGTVYHAVAAERSWRLMKDFLQEIFA